MSDTPQLTHVKSGSNTIAQKSEETTLGLPLEKIGGSLFDYQQGLNEPKKPWFSMIYVLFFLLAVAAAWASFFDINETVRSQGQFIPSARTQIVQVVDGGVLAELKVHEGDFVEAGQVLAVLERQRANACLLYTSPSPRDLSTSRMPSSA